MTVPGKVPEAKPKTIIQGVKQAPKKEDVSSIKTRAEKLIRDINDPDGIKALKQLLDGGHYKEVAWIIDNIVDKNSLDLGLIAVLDKFKPLFEKAFMDDTKKVKTDQLFQVIKYSKYTKDISDNWLITSDKKNAADIINRRIQHASLFSKLGVRDKDGDGKIGEGERYERVKRMDSDRDGKVTLEEIARHAVRQPKVSYSKELVDSILLNISQKIDVQKSVALLELMAKHDDYAKLKLATYYLDQGKYTEGVKLLHEIAKQNDDAKYMLASHYLNQGQYRKGLKLLHEYVHNNPDAKSALGEYQTLMTYFGIKDDLSNIDNPNANIRFLEDLAHYYKIKEQDLKPADRTRLIYLPSEIYERSNPNCLTNVENIQKTIKDIDTRLAQMSKDDPARPILLRVKTKLESFIKEFKTHMSRPIRISSNGKPTQKTITIDNLEQTLTVTFPAKYNLDIKYTTFRLSITDGYITNSQGWCRPVESGNPLMVKAEMPMWKVLKQFSPGSKDLKMHLMFVSESRTKTITKKVEIPTKIWGTLGSRSIDTSKLYERITQDMFNHYLEGKKGPFIMKGTWIVCSEKDHPEFHGTTITEDAYYKKSSAPFVGLPRSGFKHVGTIGEVKPEGTIVVEKPTTDLPSTGHEIVQVGGKPHYKQRWSLSHLEGREAVVSPRETRTYELKISPKHIKGGLKAKYEEMLSKLPKETQDMIKERFKREGIILRTDVHLYSDTYTGLVRHFKESTDNNNYFNLILTHRAVDMREAAYVFISSKGFKPRSKPGASYNIHCKAGASDYQGAMGPAVTTVGPTESTWGNYHSGVAFIKGLFPGGVSNRELSYTVKKAYADAKGSSRIPRWDASKEATGDQYADSDRDGLPNILDPNPRFKNIYYYNPYKRELRIYDPSSNREYVLKQFDKPEPPTEDDIYPAIRLSFLNKTLIGKSTTSLAEYGQKKKATRLAYLDLEQKPTDTQAASPK